MLGTLRFFFFLCALWALHSHVQVQERSQEATTSGAAQGHWQCCSWEFFPTHPAASGDEVSANSPDYLLQYFAALPVVKLFLLCNLDLTCCGLNTSLYLLSLGEVKNSCFLSPYGSLCFVRGLLWHLLSTRLSLSTNQLQFFWETSQPIQVKIVLQCMRLQQEKKAYFFLSLTLIVNAVSGACAWNISLTVCPCVGHYFWTHLWCLYHLLPFKTWRTAEEEGFLLS